MLDATFQRRDRVMELQIRTWIEEESRTRRPRSSRVFAQRRESLAPSDAASQGHQKAQNDQRIATDKISKANLG